MSSLSDILVMFLISWALKSINSDHSMFLAQTKYTRELLTRTNMLDAKPFSTPMSTGFKPSLHDKDPFEDVTLYRITVRALQYLTITRPNINFSVNSCNGTLEFGITLAASRSLDLHGYCDADWGSDPDDRRSISGFCWYFGSSPISWSSKKQPVVSRSSTEAEYRSLANASCG